MRLEEEAASASPLRAAVVRYELGRLLEKRHSDSHRALACYEACTSFAPAARAVTRLRIMQGEAELLIPALMAEEQAAENDEARAAALVERALVHITELSDAATAAQELEQALELVPGHQVALEALYELYSQEARYEELERLLRLQADICGDETRGSELLCRAGKVREEKLEDPDQAQALYRTALIANGDNDEARTNLLRLTHAAGDRAGEAELLEELAARRGAADAAWLLAEAGRIQQEHLGDAGQALSCLKRALPLTPREERGPLLLKVAALLVSSGRHAEAAAAYTEARSALVDPAAAAEAALELGRLQAEHLEDTEAAAATLRTALDLEPGLEPARSLLENLLMGQGAHDVLARHYRQDLQRSGSGGHAPGVGLRLGKLLEGPLADPAGAVEAYQQVLGMRPGWRPALLGLSRAYRAMGDPRLALATYDAQLLGLRDVEEKLWALEQMAEIAERELADLSRAAAIHERILALNPDQAASRSRLVQLYEAMGRWPHLAAILHSAAERSDDPGSRLQFLDHLAWVYSNRLGDDDAALETYEAALTIAPDHLPAQEGAIRLMGASGRHQDRLALMRRMEGLTGEGYARARVSLRAARVLGRDLGRWDEAASLAAEVSRRCAEVEEPDAAWRHLQGVAAELVWACYSRGALVDEAAAVFSLMKAPEGPADAASFHCRLARAFQDLGHEETARGHLTRALGVDPHCEAAHQLMAERLAADQDPAELIRLLNDRLQGLPPGPVRDELLYRLIWLEARGGMDPGRSVALLEQLSAPLDSPPIQAMMEVQLARLQDWRRLTPSMAKRSADSTADGGEPSLALFRSAGQLVAAGLTENRLDDLKEAAHLAFLVLERHPHQSEALAMMERHYRSTANAQGLIQILSRRLAEVESSVEQAALMNGLGAVWARSREMDNAGEIFRKAAETLGSYLPAVRSWTRACVSLERTEELALAHAAAASASWVQTRRVESTLEAARLWHNELEDHPRAIAAYYQLLRVDPEHQAAFAALISLLEEEGEWAQLSELLLTRAGAGGQGRREILLRVAQIRREELADIPGARTVLAEALEDNPEDVELWSEMALLCRAEMAWKELVQANLRLLELDPEPSVAIELRLELGWVLHKHLDRPGEAAVELERVLKLAPQNMEALGRLADLHIRQSEWSEAARRIEEMVDQEHVREQLITLHLRLARVQDAGLDDQVKAAESCRRALAQGPGNMEAADRLSDLLRRMGNRPSLEAHLRTTLGVHRLRIERDPTRTESFQAMAHLLGQQGDTDGQSVVQQALGVLDPEALEETPPPTSRRMARPAAAAPLSENDLRGALAHPDEVAPLYRLLQGAEAALRLVYPAAPAIAPPGPQVTERTHPQLAALINGLTETLGLARGLTVYLDQRSSGSFKLMDTASPTLVLGQGLEAMDAAEMAFQVGRLMARVRLGHMIPSRLSGRELGRLVAALLGLTCRVFSSPYPDSELEPIKATLDRGLDRQTRRQLASPSLELSDRPFIPERWLRAMGFSEDRVGLFLCGVPRAALGVMRAEESASPGAPMDRWHPGEQAGQLLRFMISDGYFELRKRHINRLQGQPPR